MIRRFLLALGFLLCGSVTDAHEGDSPVAQWYKSLRSDSGVLCCSITDCHPVQARIAGDHWEVAVDDPDIGQSGWEAVPAEAVLKRENPEYLPVLCRFGGRILCFVPGNET